jgi:hypothetical protein
VTVNIPADVWSVPLNIDNTFWKVQTSNLTRQTPVASAAVYILITGGLFDRPAPPSCALDIPFDILDTNFFVDLLVIIKPLALSKVDRGERCL